MADTFSPQAECDLLCACFLASHENVKIKIEATMINLDGSCISILGWIEEVESVIRDSWLRKPGNPSPERRELDMIRYKVYESWAIVVRHLKLVLTSRKHLQIYHIGRFVLLL